MIEPLCVSASECVDLRVLGEWHLDFGIVEAQAILSAACGEFGARSVPQIDSTEPTDPGYGSRGLVKLQMAKIWDRRR